MKRESREIETLVTTIFAAIPLYTSETVLLPAVVTFHAALSVIALSLLLSGRAPRVPETVLRVSAILYLAVFVIDAVAVSQSLIGSSTHLLFFIAVYQSLDSALRARYPQRLLVTFLIFVTSISTSTALPIIFFVLAFAFLAFRELMRISHAETVHALGREELRSPASRAAAFYVIPTAIIAAMLFPLIPRTQNPFVRGLSASLPGGSATTGIAETIDFRTARSISPDPEVIARVWMPAEAMPFFAPVRLRARIYDRYDNGEWSATRRKRRPVPVRDGAFRIARPLGYTRQMTVQQRGSQRTLLLVPDGTFAISGIYSVTEATTPGGYVGAASMQSTLEYQAYVSRQTGPLKPEPLQRLAYRAPPAVTAFARRIVGDAKTLDQAAERIEAHLRDNFEYVPDPAAIGRPISVEEFLLSERRGHCEYFAAGMVALVNSVGIPARIAGGFYGGELNPLTSYFSIRKSDAHAWVEVFDGEKWRVFDPTPPSLRPGNVSKGIVHAYVSALGDYVGYVWDRYVLTFGLGDQMLLFTRFFEGVRDAVGSFRMKLVQFSAKDFLRSIAPAAVIGLFVLAAVLILSRRQQPIIDRLIGIMERSGLAVRASMTAGELRRLAVASHPSAFSEIDTVVEYHMLQKFSPSEPPREMRTRAELALRSIERSLSRDAANGAGAGSAGSSRGLRARFRRAMRVR